MKRIGKSLAALVLALVMSLTLLPVQAMAVEGDLTGKGGLKTVYTGEYVNPLYADALGAETSGWSQFKTSIQWVADVQTAADEPYLTEAEAVKELQRQMIAREESITINVQVPSGADLQKKMAAWWQDALAHTSKNGSAGDYLRWQYAGYSSSALTSNGSDWKVTYAAHEGMTSIWYTNAAQEKNLTNYIQSTILPQLALDGKTTYQKVKAIYDWITRNVRYDEKNKDDNSYYLKYTAYAAAIDKKAVCQGYTNLFYRLANDAGIDCRIITGGNHAWNIVQMDDGKYYCMDATWDEGQSSYSYFLKGLPEFSKTHRPQTDPQNTPYWTAYESKMSDTDYNAAPVVPKPTVPANVKLVSAKAVSDGIQVKWQAADGAVQYRVYRKDAVNTKWKALTSSAIGTSYVDDTAKAGVKYSYTVRGIAADGKTLSPGFDETGVSAVAAPANVKMGTAVAGKNGITVKWQAADGAVRYRVYRKDAANTGWKNIATVNDTIYTDKTAVAGVKYSYTVRGIASDGKTLSLGYDETGVSAVAAPANVTLGTAVAGKNGITVTWKEAAGAAEYRVYRKGPNDKRWVGLTNVTGKNWTDTDVTKGVKYSYTVRGIAADGKTLSPGFDETGVSAVAAPANVKLVSATAVSGGIQVKWQAADGAVRYRVYRKDAVNTKWKALTSSATGTGYTDKTAVAGVEYTYTVRGIASDGKTLSLGFNKTGVSATIPAPANVKLVGATAVDGGITVTWQAADGAAEYRVYRKDAVNTKWKALTSSATGTSYTDKTAVVGVQYTYTVRGIAADGKTLSPSYDKTGVSATAAPANVTLGSAKAVNNGIQVTWQKAEDAAKYRVYRKDAANTRWKTIATVSGTSYTDKTAKIGTRYTYTVRGIAFDGKTLSPGYDKTGVSATATPARVALVGAKRVATGTKGIQVTWKSAANAQTYNVYRAVNPPSGDVPASAWALVGEKVNALSFTDTTGKSGTMYAYTVRGVAVDGKTLSAAYNEYGVRATMP